MSSKSSLNALLACCSLLVLAHPGIARADAPAAPADKPAAAAPSIAEIIVTATRSVRSLQQVPMSVDVVTADQLNKLKIFDVKDISQLSPGLELTNYGGRNNTTTLRGLTFDPDQGTAPTVNVYYNEVTADAQTVYTALYDIKQIEVLRGPQGLLRGATAPAGSITIATERPSFTKVEASIQATGTDRHAYNVQAALSIPINPNWAIRFAGLVDGNRINQVCDVNRGGDCSRSRTGSGRVTLGYTNGSNLTAYITYQYLEAHNNQYQQVMGAGNTPEAVYAELFGTPSIFLPPAYGGGPWAIDPTVRSGPALTPGDYKAVSDGVYDVVNKSTLLNLNVNWDLGPVTVALIGGHQRSNVVTNRDTDLDNAIPGYIQSSYVNVTYPLDTEELRVTSNAKEGFGWEVGFFHAYQAGAAINNIDNSLFNYNVAPSTFVKSPLGPGGSFITVPNQLPLSVYVNVPIHVESTSVNANAHYYSGPWKIEAGLRYSILNKRQSTIESFSGFENVAPFQVIPAELQHSLSHPLTGGASIDYAINDTTNAYLSYGHSFRQRTTGVSTPVGISNDLVQTKDEKTDSVELGLKGSLLDRKLHYSLAAYYQKFDGYIALFPSIYYYAPLNSNVNGTFAFNYNGNATSKGIEATLNGQIVRNWDFGLNMSYNHARYDNAKLPCNDYAGTGIPNQTGNPAVTGSGNVSYCISNGRIAQIPDFTMTGNTEVRFPVGNLTPYLAAQFSYRPGFFADQVQYQYQDRELVNLYVGVRGPQERWSLDLFAKNALNQQRVVNAALGTGTITAIIAGVYNSGYRAINTMNPREFGITVRYRW